MSYSYWTLSFLSFSWLLALSFTGLNVTMLAATLILLLCAMLFSLKRGVYVNHKGISLLMALIIIWFSCSLFLSQAPYRSWLYVMSFVSFPIAYFISQNIVDRKLYKYLAMLVFAAGALFTFGVRPIPVLSSLLRLFHE